jgi:16S rRNA (uracil1498-N3)-methyltransferase
MPRVFISSSFLEPGLRGEEFDLDSDTAKKLTRVLRLTSGEIFVAFDGVGGEWECVLTSVNETGKGARAAILNEVPTEIAPRLHISVAQAVPKGEKMEFVLQKGTELGVAEFWPLLAGRSVPTFEDEMRASVRADRWRKIVQGACAQCGRADVPVVHAPCEFATAVDYGTNNGSRCFMLDERGGSETLRQALTREALLSQDENRVLDATELGAAGRDATQPDNFPSPRRVMLLIGPEGGWTEREREWADRYGVESVGLGRSILRTETAALVAVSILCWEAGELG